VATGGELGENVTWLEGGQALQTSLAQTIVVVDLKVGWRLGGRFGRVVRSG